MRNLFDQLGKKIGLEAQCALLLHQLRTRFGGLPEAGAARVEAAPARDLHRWADRILTAQALDDVFGKA